MTRMLRFPDRAAAGRALAERVLGVTTAPTVVLGVPHGGIVTAGPVALALGAPLAAVWVRKLAAPREPDTVLGAVDLDGDVTICSETVRAEGLSDEEVAEIAWHAHQRLLHEWERAPGLDAASLLAGAHTAVIVDDALVTGLTLRAAARWARRQGARQIALAVPVVDGRIWEHLAREADQRIALEVRDGVIARSDVYEEWHRIRPEDVDDLLARHA